MAIQNARILIRRGLEADFNPDGLQPGEWALSVDRGKEILRVCVSPGEFIRIATYESFEKDMAQIEAILAECETIEEAVTAIQEEINAKEVVFESYVQQAKGYSETAAAEASKATTEADRAESEADRAKQYRDEAEQFRNEAFTSTPEGYQELIDKVDSLKEKEGVDTTASEIGENIHLTDTTDNKAIEFTLYGKATQNGTPTPDAPVEIEVAGASGSVEVTTSNEENTKSTTATISTPNGLPGIPVSSGGNYTDENGQQWICDEIVKYADGSGKRIQIIEEHTDIVVWSQGQSNYGYIYAFTYNGENKENIPFLSTHFHFVKNKSSSELNIGEGYVRTGSTTPVISVCSNVSTVEEFQNWLNENAVFYTILAEPIITDLSAEEIAEIEKLQTFYPVTNISNDADCGMNIEYIQEKNITTQTAIEFVNVSDLGVLKSGDTIPTAFAKIKSFMEQGGSGGTAGTTDYEDLSNMGSATALDTYEEIMANTESGKFAGAKGVKEGFSAINDSLQNLDYSWKLFGSAIGTNKIDITNLIANELYIVIDIEYTSGETFNASASFVIPFIRLTEHKIIYHCGDFTMSSYGSSFVANVNKNEIYIDSVYIHSQEYTSNATITVYYR